MLQLKYNGGFLDLGADQKLEFERENPMFILEDFYKEYSTPIVIKYSENNVALLGGLFFDDFKHQRLKVDVELWDKGTFDSNVTLVVDKTNVNRRNAGKGDVNGYLYAGLSRFFYKIKYRFLNTLEFGGPRVFNLTTFNFDDGSNGYYQHFKQTWDNTYDYIVAPIRNDIWNGDVNVSSGWMNDLFWKDISDPGTAPAEGSPEAYIYYNLLYQRIVFLFPRLKYVLTCIFKENGYAIDTSELDGTGWENIFLLSLFGNILTAHPDPLSLYISDCISPEITCSYFILQILKKYGWTLISNGVDSYKIIALKDVKSFVVKDITPFVSDAALGDYSYPQRIEAFKNTFPESEQLATGATPTLADGIYLLQPVVDKSQLPDLSVVGGGGSTIYDQSRVYVYNDNKFYKVGLSVSPVPALNNLRQWQPDVDNIYNIEPPNNNYSIESDVTTLPVYWTQYRRSSGSNILYYGYFPVCKQKKTDTWGIRTLLFVGLVTETYMQTPSGPLTLAMSESTTAYTETPTLGTFQYPLLSSIRNNGNTDILPWSNVYTHPKNGVDYGIISYWFKVWLDTTALMNVYERNIYFTKNDLKSLAWNTILTICNVPYLIQSYTEPIPYKGFVLAKLIRLIFDKKDATITISNSIYIKFDWEDEVSVADYTVDDGQGTGTFDVYTNQIKAKPIIRAYSDPNCVNPITNIYLKLLFVMTTTDAEGNIYPALPPYGNIGMYWVKGYFEAGSFNMASSLIKLDLNFIAWGDYTSVNMHDIPASSDLMYFKSWTFHNTGTSDTKNVVAKYNLGYSPNYIIIP